MTAICSAALHPVYGPDEDRNRGGDDAAIGAQYGLHPVYGPDEDRNVGQVEGDPDRGVPALHPVYGPDEDRN